eukprot:447605_1
MSHTFELIILCVAIFVLVVFAIVLLALIVHLIYKTIGGRRTKKNKDRKKLIILLVVTIAGISSWMLSIIFIIIAFVEILILHFNLGMTEKIFFASYVTFAFISAAFNSLGHVGMFYVFISRFQYTFANNIMFHQSKCLLSFMYIMLSVSIIVSFIILCFIFPSDLSASQLLIWEIGWEFCVESTIFFISFLFISKLYKLLRFSFVSHMKNGNKNELISEITNKSLERSKSSVKKSNKSKTKSNQNKPQWTMTIDGTQVDPITPVQSVNNSVKSTLYKSDEEKYDKSDNNLTDHEDEAKHISVGHGKSQIVEVIAVMNKMSVLCIVSTIGSFVTIFGTFFVEYEGNYNKKNIVADIHDVHDPKAIWIFVLPALHMFIASLILYLQFNFSHAVYRKVFKYLDIMFLKCMLAVITYWWNTEDNDEKHASFIVDNNKNNKQMAELQTKSTVTSAATATSVEIVTDNQIQPNTIQMQIENYQIFIK